MIAELNTLSLEAKRELLGTLSATDALAVLNGDDQTVMERLVSVIKTECLNGTRKDFSLALRKQLLQAGEYLGVFWQGHSTDLLVDAELAALLVKAVVQDCDLIDPSTDPFFRTKRESEKDLAKTAVETQSPKALALIAGALFMSEDRAARARKSLGVQNTVKLCAFMVQA